MRDLSFAMDTLKSMSLTQYTHCFNVGHIAKTFGEFLNLDDQSINQLIIGGFLHDIGKVSFSNELLDSDKLLNQDDMRLIRHHPIIGLEIITPFITDTNIREIVVHHHERYDGNGYPDQLSDNQIPYLVKIISVIDAFDVMIHGRTYQKALTLEKAIDEINQNAGKQFDPKIARRFIEFIKKQQ